MQVERGISVERVKECFDIDPNTGEMAWKWRGGVPNRINKRHAGKPAANGRNAGGYLRVKIDGVRFGAHRVAYVLYHSKWPSGQVDHINGVKDDNRKENLRDVAPALNSRNAKMYVSNTSGITCVSFHKASGRYRAAATLLGKQHHLGLFDTIEEAVKVRDEFYADHEFTNRHGASHA